MGAYDDGGFTRAIAAAKAAGIPTQSAGTPFGQAGSKAPIKVEVERGDTLSSIAKENNTTVKAILAANPKFTEDPKYKGGNTIFAGTKVVIPPTMKTPKVPATKPVETPLTTATTSSTTSDTTTSTATSTATTSTATTSTTTSTTTTETVETSGGSSGSSVNSTPLTPADITTASVAAALPPAPPVKTAPIDTVLFNDDELPIEVMTDLIFENIGGQELINIARNDIVNGQQISYQPIKNLSSIQQQYNPNNILSLQATSDKYFANFPIKLENKIPSPGTGPNGTHVYFDSINGNLIIEAVNVEPDEQLEVEITVSGTIYEAEFGEIVS
jgi:LysM repeat protein